MDTVAVSAAAGSPQYGAVSPGSSPQRPTVYVENGSLDSIPFSRRGLQLTPVSAGTRPELERDARALVFIAGDLETDEARRQLSKWAARAIRPALNYGTACMILAPAKQAAQARHGVKGVDPDARVLISAEPNALAQKALLHDPGVSPGRAPEVTSKPQLSDELVLLLKRAFHDFQEVKLTALLGGRSKAEVWRVDCIAPDQDLSAPFVVKFGPRQPIGEELGIYRALVMDRIPFRGCAPVCLDRSVEGAGWQLMVSRFVERATRLDDVLKGGNDKILDAERLVSGIYEGPLHRWRQHTTRATLSIFAELCDPHVLRRKAELGETWARLGGAESGLLEPVLMLERLSSVRLEDVPVCLAHGDLNLRNVFVAEPNFDVVLIDFARSKRRPLSRDIARLDVGLGFDADLQSWAPLEDEALEQFFGGEHFRLSLLHGAECLSGRVRLNLIQALRRQMVREARRLSYDPVSEYAVAVAAELLYHARRKCRSAEVAYRCASRIATSLPLGA